VPLVRYSTVAGIPLADLVKMGLPCTQARLTNREAGNRQWRRESSISLKTDPAFLRAGASAIAMAESYLKGHRSVCCPALRFLKGEYGVRYVWRVPVVIGERASERVVRDRSRRR